MCETPRQHAPKVASAQRTILAEPVDTPGKLAFEHYSIREGQMHRIYAVLKTNPKLGPRSKNPNVAVIVFHDSVIRKAVVDLRWTTLS